MRRWMVYALVLALLFFISPAAKTDVGERKPVEMLTISGNGPVTVEADTGDWGTGQTLEEAITDMKATASGYIFLDTVDYLVIAPESVSLLPELWQLLRPATQVCLGTQTGPETARYLSAHKPGVTLNDIRGGREKIPTLKKIEERYHLE